MEASRCQLLYLRWRTVAETHAAALAVREPDGTAWTFEELARAAEKAPPCAGVIIPQTKGVAFLLEVLRAWRDDSVFAAVEPESTPPVLTGPWQEAVCHVKLTSGSTGHPRLVLVTAAQLAADCDHIVRTMGLRADWPNVCVISLAHSYGFSNLVLPLLLHGIPLLLAESPLPEAMRAVLEHQPAVTLAAVPAMWRAWHAAGIIDGRIRLAISAGAPLPLELEQTVFATTGVKIHNFYGSSECGGIAYDRSTEPRTDGSFAGSAMEGVTLSIHPDSGCLQVRSDAVALDYAEPDSALADGVFLTPDIVRLDADHVWLLGRSSEAINVAGRKITPSLIEQKLLALPGIAQCVVFGVPSVDAGRVEEIVACVRLAAGVDLAAVRSASMRELPLHEQPRRWQECPALEPDARGKISRTWWREQWLRECR